jgi:hypothetical protein
LLTKQEKAGIMEMTPGMKMIARQIMGSTEEWGVPHPVIVDGVKIAETLNGQVIWFVSAEVARKHNLIN